MSRELLQQALDVLASIKSPMYVDEILRVGKVQGAIRDYLAQPATASIVPKWTDEELAQGRVGIRWVRDDRVYGRPNREDVLKYIESRWPDQPAPAVPAVREPRPLAAVNRYCAAGMCLPKDKHEAGCTAHGIGITGDSK